jgi:hypothetical protein
MPVPPLIATEELEPHEQYVGQSLSDQLNPTDANLKTAGTVAVAIGLTGLLLAVRNPKYALGVMTATMGAAMLGAFVALSRPSSDIASQPDLGPG